MIGTDAYAREVLREYRTRTRGLTLARLRASKARDLLPLETVVIEARQLLSEQVPQTTNDILLLNRELKKKGVFVALRNLDILSRHIKTAIQQKKGRPFVGRLGYEWARSRAKLGRPRKTAGKYLLEQQMGERLARGMRIAAIADEMIQRTAVPVDKNKETRAFDKWEKRIKREKARILSTPTADTRSMKLNGCVRALLSRYPKMEYETALLQICERIRRAAARRKLPTKTYDDLLNAASLI